MDEIIIGEKKYISSKQAAKMTGYAKDYIGQLCREGRVPARLVGRGWYVLETAIKDHRFGDQKTEQEAETESPAAVFPSKWESPRYEASSFEVLPSVNRLQDVKESIPEEEAGSEVAQHLQDSWKAWFDRVAMNTSESVAAIEPEKQQEEEVQKEEEGDVQVPIHAIYEPIPQELLPPRRRNSEVRSSSEEQVTEQQKKGSRVLVRAIQMAGVTFAVLAVIVASVGTGYFDTYITSVSQASVISGVTLYNR
ncbi:MAG: helix-turn-helix domain-containing protein [Candidatus Kaiserbacteria bacterium]|nr:helix-turn-helix domain-containing protein [Candidatus Kaiserbacteria bacterium]